MIKISRIIIMDDYREWSSRSRARPDYREYRGGGGGGGGGGRDRYSPGRSQDMAPPMKRMRSDWDDRASRYPHSDYYGGGGGGGGGGGSSWPPDHYPQQHHGNHHYGNHNNSSSSARCVFQYSFVLFLALTKKQR